EPTMTREVFQSTTTNKKTSLTYQQNHANDIKLGTVRRFTLKSSVTEINNPIISETLYRIGMVSCSGSSLIMANMILRVLSPMTSMLKSAAGKPERIHFRLTGPDSR